MPAIDSGDMRSIGAAKATSWARLRIYCTRPHPPTMISRGGWPRSTSTEGN